MMLQLPPLYPITDATRPEPLADQVRRFGEAGFSLVQFRGKPLTVAGQYAQLKQALEEAQANGGWPRIVVNDRADLALVLASEGLSPWGLHLGQGDLPHHLAARLPGLETLHFGGSTHGPRDWEGAAPPMDHAGVGPLRATATKTGHAAPLGLDGLAEGCAALRTRGLAPIAIGGLRPEDAEACFQTGAESLGMVGALRGDLQDLAWTIQCARWKVRPPVNALGCILVGPSGAGKSALGQALALRLGLPFRDLDPAVEARAGRSIAELFASHGEAAFRTLEQEVLPSLLESPAVVALGGGAWHQEEIRALVVRCGIKPLWLAEPPRSTWSRIAQDPARPLAQSEDTHLARCAQRLQAWGRCEAVSSFGRGPNALAQAMASA